jgi:hypothetical protein
MQMVATVMTYAADAGGIVGGLASAAALGVLLREWIRKLRKKRKRSRSRR